MEPTEETPQFGVIFDLDGLLVDSERVQAMAFNETLAVHGISLSDEEFCDLVGWSTWQNFLDIKKRHHLSESVESLIARKDISYSALVPRHMNAMPGALVLVRDLHVAGVPMAVASSSFRKDVQACLRTVGLASMLPMLATGDEVEHTKPAADLYLLAVRRLGTAPNQCIAFEDTQTGLRAAHAAGVPCVAVPNHYSRHHDFSLATRCLNSLEETSIAALNALIR